MSDFKPLTRGQRKRREALERVKKKQDLIGYLLKQKQLGKIHSSSNCTTETTNKIALYNFSKLKDQIENAVDSKSLEKEPTSKRNMSRKRIQKIRENSLGYMKQVLSHPDFEKLEEVKSRLFHNIENSSKNILSLPSKNGRIARGRNKKKKLNKSTSPVKVNKNITKN